MRNKEQYIKNKRLPDYTFYTDYTFYFQIQILFMCTEAGQFTKSCKIM